MKLQVGEWVVDTELLEAKCGYGYPVDLQERARVRREMAIAQ